jgi:hypothetical protein
MHILPFINFYLAFYKLHFLPNLFLKGLYFTVRYISLLKLNEFILFYFSLQNFFDFPFGFIWV